MTQDPCQSASTLIAAYTARQAVANMSVLLIEAHCKNAEMTGRMCDECNEASSYILEEAIFCEHMIGRLIKGEAITDAVEAYTDKVGSETIETIDARANGTIVTFPVQPGKPPF